MESQLQRSIITPVSNPKVKLSSASTIAIVIKPNVFPSAALRQSNHRIKCRTGKLSKIAILPFCP